MKTLAVPLSESCLAAFQEAARRHERTPEDLAAEIIVRCLEGEDCRRELRRLRDDISVLAQAIVTLTNVADPETARQWVNEELRLER